MDVKYLLLYKSFTHTSYCCLDSTQILYIIDHFSLDFTSKKIYLFEYLLDLNPNIRIQNTEIILTTKFHVHEITSLIIFEHSIHLFYLNNYNLIESKDTSLFLDYLSSYKFRRREYTVRIAY